MPGYTEKRCKTCGEVKPTTEFCRDKQNSDGFRAHCKICWQESSRVHRQENLDRILERERVMRENNRELLRERGRQWARDNMDQMIEYQRRRDVDLKAEVLAHYGASCTCCGCEEFGQLTVDHIDGNGGEHRIELFGSQKSAGRVFYQWLIRNGFPEGYQILCRSCNYSKGKRERCQKDHSREGGQLAG